MNYYYKDHPGKDHSPEAHEFLKAICELQKKHGFTLEHEDGHGAFLVTRPKTESDYSFGWLMGAMEY